jgi:SAM-dependent methyltransferase
VDLQTLIKPPTAYARLPDYDHGWIVEGGAREPFLSYVGADASVNWSAELELLHEEASRTSVIDQWTRRAIITGLGELPAHPTIIDIGASTGYLLEDLAAAFSDATLLGIDRVSSGLRKAHEAVPSAHLLHADACALPVASASADAVVSANTLEHISDDAGALTEVARVLKPGARAVIVVPAGPRTYDYYDRFVGHERRYARHELAVKGRAAGLEIIEDSYIAALLYPAFWLVKQHNRLRFGSPRRAGPRTACRLRPRPHARLGRMSSGSAPRLVRCRWSSVGAI